MKTPFAVVILAVSAFAQTPAKPAAPAPTPYEPAKAAVVAVLKAQVAQKDTQMAVLADPKYAAMIAANNDLTNKAVAACPAKGDQKYQLDLTALQCVPAK